MFVSSRQRAPAGIARCGRSPLWDLAYGKPAVRHASSFLGPGRFRPASPTVGQRRRGQLGCGADLRRFRHSEVDIGLTTETHLVLSLLSASKAESAHAYIDSVRHVHLVGRIGVEPVGLLVVTHDFGASVGWAPRQRDGAVVDGTADRVARVAAIAGGCDGRH